MRPARAWLRLAAAAVCWSAGAWLCAGCAEADRGPRTGDAGPALTLFCAAGVKRPVAAVAARYREEVGGRVELDYAGSGTLLSKIRVARRGDLYLAAEQSYIDEARALGLVAEVFPLAVQRPCIAVAAGNPKGVRSVADLLSGDATFALANPDAAAVGRVTKRALEAAGLWREAAERATVFKPTVSDALSDVRVGAVDAAIVWDATVHGFGGLDVVEDPVFADAVETVSIGVLTSSERPTEALRFARYLSARDRGMEIFASMGFTGVGGDAWAETPRVTLFAGSMFNAVIDETIASFEAREGCEVTRVYNGCGILVAQMRAGASPDAYLSCDEVFMEDVRSRFGPWTDVSENPLVIAVAKGNPEGVRGLADLASPGLRLGLAHPEKSALGELTRRMLSAEGLLGRIESSGNWVVDSPTGDFLVNQLRTGSLDAVVAYISNVRTSSSHGAHLDVIALDGATGALAKQPYAVAAETAHPRLMRRLREAILAASSRERFEAAGFRWVGGAPGAPAAP